jgi:hypothetical protein
MSESGRRPTRETLLNTQNSTINQNNDSDPFIDFMVRFAINNNGSVDWIIFPENLKE